MKEEIKKKIYNKLSSFINKSQEEICSIFNIENLSSKSINNIIITNILKDNDKTIMDYKEDGFIFKTINLSENNTIKENMSFPNFKFNEIVEEKWNTSELKNYFKKNTFVFIVFKDKGDSKILYKVIFWDCPSDILENEIKEVWCQTVDLLKQGKIVKDFSNGKYQTYFPKATLNHVCHVRPHDSKGIDHGGQGYELPVPDKLTGLTSFTKQCFWLDRTFILSIINNN